ncbi:MAG: hypothetical protein R6W72_10545 [Desulfurivibrionaceae bacterium]
MKKLVKITILVSCLLLVPFLTACDREGPMERAGENVDEAVEETGEAVEDAGDEVRE